MVRVYTRVEKKTSNGDTSHPAVRTVTGPHHLIPAHPERPPLAIIEGPNTAAEERITVREGSFGLMESPACRDSSGL